MLMHIYETRQAIVTAVSLRQRRTRRDAFRWYVWYLTYFYSDG